MLMVGCTASATGAWSSQVTQRAHLALCNLHDTADGGLLWPLKLWQRGLQLLSDTHES